MRSMSSHCLPAIILLALPACIEGRKEQTVVDGAVADTTADTRQTTLDFGPDSELDTVTYEFGPLEDRCVVAIRVDHCCSGTTPAFEGDLVADSCLVLWPPFEPVSAACQADWPTPACESPTCSYLPPPSRLAENVGGDCQFVDECEDENDCVVAQNKRLCCPHDDAYPRAQLDIDPCIVDANTQPPSSCAPLQGCPASCPASRTVEGARCDVSTEAAYAICAAVFGL